MPVEQEDELKVVIKFGGGQHSSASEDEIDAREGVLVENCKLDLNNRNLRNRKAIDKVGTAPNGGQINGFATLVQTDGTTTLLIQAGDTVYSWSAAAGFVNVGTVNSNMKMRGHMHQYWPLDDKLIITDLALVDVVMEWDGGTLSDMSHNLVGDFKAKYCWIDNERVRYAHVNSNSTTTEHMIVTSKLSDYDNLSTSDKPSSALGIDDPYYVLTPDLRAINGLAGAFGVVAVSSEAGSMHKITGEDSSDTLITTMYPRSFASGDESMAYVGNDIVFGRVGRIETMSGTESFGDVLTDDLSLPVADAFIDLKDWTIVYNARTQKIYFHAAGKEYIWEYTKPMAESGLSPWNKIVTDHEFSANPTAMMTVVDPADGLEYVFMGDASGDVYRLEGTGTDGDGGSADIKMKWKSKLFEVPPEMTGNSFQGYVDYRSGTGETITIKFLFAGSEPSNESFTVSLQGTPGENFWGEDIYWGGDNYWGVPFEGTFRRENFDQTGQGEKFQIQVEYEGTGDIEINEIGVTFSGDG